MPDEYATLEDVHNAVVAGLPCPSCDAEWTEPDEDGVRALPHTEDCVKYRNRPKP